MLSAQGWGSKVGSHHFLQISKYGCAHGYLQFWKRGAEVGESLGLVGWHLEPGLVYLETQMKSDRPGFWTHAASSLGFSMGIVQIESASTNVYTTHTQVQTKITCDIRSWNWKMEDCCDSVIPSECCGFVWFWRKTNIALRTEELLGHSGMVHRWRAEAWHRALRGCEPHSHLLSINQYPTLADTEDLTCVQM